MRPILPIALALLLVATLFAPRHPVVVVLDVIAVAALFIYGLILADEQLDAGGED